MALRFILGRAGSGKTRYCLEAVAAEVRRSPDGAPLLLLVPEQATFQTDRALMSHLGARGSARAHVLSFGRLAWRVFAETGGGARPHIDDVGKAMALRVLLGRRRDQLRVFSGLAGQAGFLARLAGTISELHAYGVTPEHLELGYASLAALGRGDTALAGKLHDLALMTRDLTEYLAGRWTDPDDYLTLLATRILEKPSCVDQARVWVDSFAGFTPRELSVLSGLLEVADEIHVALCLNPDDLTIPGDDPATFRLTQKTYHVLTALALATGGPSPPARLELRETRRFVSAPALAHLERLWPQPERSPSERTGPPLKGPPLAGSGDLSPITLIAAESRRAEVAAAGREMVRLARDEGFRWRDMAVVVRRIDDYADLLETALADYGVPFFLDRRRPMSYHPLVELIRSALETANSHWSPEPLFRLLKTDLFPISRAEADLLENYVLAHGVRGRAWTRDEPWAWRRLFSLDRTAPPDPNTDELLAGVDAVRRRVASLLVPMADALHSGASTIRASAAALWEFIERLEAPATLERWRREALASGDPGAAQEHERILGDIITLLDQLVDNLGDQVSGPSEFLRMIEAGLESVRVGLVPPGLDQVNIGSIERSRQPEIKACFVLGLNEGCFPASSPEDIVFDDRERGELAAFGMDLAPGGREKALNEDYFVYIALTRSSERLWLSYARSGEDGRALAPSSVVARLKVLFPELEETALGLAPSIFTATGEDEVLGEVVRLLTSPRASTPRATTPRASSPRCSSPRSEDSDEDVTPWLEAYNWLVASEARRGRTRAALAAVHRGNRVRDLDRTLAAELYGRPTRISVSRLQDYAACPYRHFAQSGLRLEPRPKRQLRAPDIGSYYHAILSVFSDDLLRDRADLGDLDATEVDRRLDRAVDVVAPRLQSEILMSSARNRYLAGRLRRSVGRAAEVLAEHQRRGAFRPLRPEWRFALDLGDVTLHGVLDRLEVAVSEGGPHIRVIDFKSSPRRFDLRLAYHALDIQLPAYLLAATDPATTWETDGRPGEDRPPPGAVPAGALFLPVGDPLVNARGPLDDASLATKRWAALLARGVVSASPEIIRLMDRRADDPDPPLLPVLLKADGTPDARGGGLRPEAMPALLRFTREKLSEIGRRISLGRVEIAPVRLERSETACRFCDYRPVCRFDPAAGDAHRRLPPEPVSDFRRVLDEGDSP